jgi:N-acetylglucosamine-6-sulfatase
MAGIGRAGLRLWAAAGALAVMVAFAVAGGGTAIDPSKAATQANRAKEPPNIVFVLTDDLSWNLLRYMPHVQAMRGDGETFTSYFVTDSLCCPSRASIFSGRLPHNTHVFTNTPPDGGFQLFHDRGEERHTFATAIRDVPHAHYRTAMMGKYLNGYQPTSLYVPPGWTEWDVAGNAYSEYNYNLNENGRLVSYGNESQDYLTDVLAHKGTRFIRETTRAGHPFLLEIATFAPHAPFTPARRDVSDFPGLGVPRTPAFDAQNLNPPTWLGQRTPLTTDQVAELDTKFRRRAQAVEAVDDLIGRIERALRDRGVARNTYLVFSSDNGFHMGDHRLLQGKMTAFDSDIRVPLIVVGPGVPAGRKVGKLAENVDLRPTFSRLAGAGLSPRIDGHSLAPLLHGHRVDRWRTATLIEHHGPDQTASDPDAQPNASGNPMSYEAMRRGHAIYVEYVDGEREYYSLSRDHYELDNTFANLGHDRRVQLHRTLARLEGCSGSDCFVTSP